MEPITVEKEELINNDNTENNNTNNYDDPEIQKLHEVMRLIKSLFTDNSDREVEIADLTEYDISSISQLKFYDKVLGFDLFHDMSSGFMRLSFSKNRKSRGEIITAIRSLVANDDSEAQPIEQKSRFRRWIDEQ